MSSGDALIPPRMTPLSEPFWEGCRQGELRLQHCLDCGHVQFPPRLLCTNCRSPRLEWRAASGRGTVETLTWVHVPLSEAWASDVPYAVALVRLEEGPRMMSNLRGCTPADMHIGDVVRVQFEQRGESLFLPQFRRAAD